MFRHIHGSHTRLTFVICYHGIYIKYDYYTHFDAFALVLEEIEVFEYGPEVIGVVVAFFSRIARYGHVRRRNFFGAAGHAGMPFEQLGTLTEYHLSGRENIIIIIAQVAENIRPTELKNTKNLMWKLLTKSDKNSDGRVRDAILRYENNTTIHVRNRSLII